MADEPSAAAEAAVGGDGAQSTEPVAMSVCPDDGAAATTPTAEGEAVGSAVVDLQESSARAAVVTEELSRRLDAVSSLFAHFSEACGEVAVLRRQISGMTRQRQERESAATALRDEFDHTIQELDQAMAAKDRANRQASDALKEQSRLQSDLAASDRELQELRRSKDTLESELSSARAHSMTLAQQIAGLRGAAGRDEFGADRTPARRRRAASPPASVGQLNALRREAREVALEVAGLRKELREARESERKAIADARRQALMLDDAEGRARHGAALADGARVRAESAEAEVAALLRELEAVRVELRRKGQVVDAIAFGVPAQARAESPEHPDPCGVSRVEYLRQLLAEKDQLVRQLSQSVAIADAKTASAEGALMLLQSQPRRSPSPPDLVQQQLKEAEESQRELEAARDGAQLRLTDEQLKTQRLQERVLALEGQLEDARQDRAAPLGGAVHELESSQRQLVADKEVLEAQLRSRDADLLQQAEEVAALKAQLQEAQQAAAASAMQCDDAAAKVAAAEEAAAERGRATAEAVSAKESAEADSERLSGLLKTVRYRSAAAARDLERKHAAREEEIAGQLRAATEKLHLAEAAKELEKQNALSEVEVAYQQGFDAAQEQQSSAQRDFTRERERLRQQIKKQRSQVRTTEKHYTSTVADLEVEVRELRDDLTRVRQAHTKEAQELRQTAERLSARAEGSKVRERELAQQLRQVLAQQSGAHSTPSRRGGSPTRQPSREPWSPPAARHTSRAVVRDTRPGSVR
eukprot:TRINITY_DN1336_c0_g1_i5.p2 TRINITY_DN1336_c0_g1~~TRINITY_DN1336_c0_g1_i5.p2  ORF type:complete len:760 (+),score=270.15 TRINITY_DN1336_c0_g1_i5:49-2328(+)